MGKKHDGDGNELDALRREVTELKFQNLRLWNHIETIRTMGLHDGARPIVVVISKPDGEMEIQKADGI